MVRPNTPDQNPPRWGVTAAVTLQVTIAVACALVAGQLANAATAVHVLLAVLTLFTSANRATSPPASPPPTTCARCGHRQ